ncbi:MAG TPA: AraC family transcriptional regulator [Lachnospiraceae bacterium]|nr:AraC family transcriptional regulator [Lachnospiraceae bacterium]
MRSHEQGVLNGSNYYIYTPSLQAEKTFFYPLFVGHFYYSSDYHLERNSYDSFLFMYIKKGQCFVCQDSKTYTLNENQVIMIDCYKPHSYYTTTGWEAQWLHFDGPLAREYYSLISTTIGCAITLMDNYRFEETLQKIYSMFKENTSIKEVLLNKYITDLLTQVLLAKDSDINHSKNTDSIEETTTYINEHLREELTLDFLAAKASLSPYYFIKLFKKQIGLTPHDYLIAARINHAKFLLKTTDLSIKEICYRCGFSSESSFCSTFKKREQITPSSYREVRNTI